jgi:hypothetical protein
LGLTALLVLIITAVSVAAPLKGAKFTGSMTDSTTASLTFKVSKDGKRVTKLRLARNPNKCGNGDEVPRQRARAARIRKGRFTATVKFMTMADDMYATARVTGRFTSRRSVRGTVSTHFRDSEAKYCNGSYKYTAKAR